MRPAWREQFPEWHFAGRNGDNVMLRGPDPQLKGGTFGLAVHKLCDDWEGKDIIWWNQHGPTKPMMEKHQLILSEPLASKAAKKKN